MLYVPVNVHLQVSNDLSLPVSSRTIHRHLRACGYRRRRIQKTLAIARGLSWCKAKLSWHAFRRWKSVIFYLLSISTSGLCLWICSCNDILTSVVFFCKNCGISTVSEFWQYSRYSAILTRFCRTLLFDGLLVALKCRNSTRKTVNWLHRLW